MEPFCVIIPNRPGREKLFDHCIWQINRMTLKPEMIYNIDYPAKGDGIDIGERMNEGVRMAKADGFDLCFVIENDDWYPINYFDRLITRFSNGNINFDFVFDAVGSEDTIYYHLKNKTWELTTHQRRSSLFTTGFRISALKDFVFPTNTPFVDIALWKNIKGRKKFVDTGAVGIKGHGAGLAAGKGHRQIMGNKDPNYSWLKSRVDLISFEFYMSLL